jgi:hypothetical protein
MIAASLCNPRLTEEMRDMPQSRHITQTAED